MKTISLFFLVFTLIILGCSKSDDLLPVDQNDEVQLKSAENKTVVTTRTFHFATVVNCDGNIVGMLDGVLTFKIRMHHNKGEWDNFSVSGILNGSGQFEGEEFKFNYQDKTEYTDGGSWDNEDWTYFKYHFVAIGNKGSRILNSAEVIFLDEEPWYEIIPIKSKCL